MRFSTTLLAGLLMTGILAIAPDTSLARGGSGGDGHSGGVTRALPVADLEMGSRGGITDITLHLFTAHMIPGSMIIITMLIRTMTMTTPTMYNPHPRSPRRSP